MTAPAPASLLPEVVDVVTVEGPDAATFLQGQLSQEIPSLDEDGWAWSFVLSPDGKIDALVRVHRAAGDRYDLVVDVGFGEAVQARLSRFKLRTDCTISLDTRTIGEPPSEHERIEAGVPTMGRDLVPGDLAASTPLVADAVDFTKGCFVGQELVARMDSRGGSAPTRLVRLRSSGEPPDAGVPVHAPSGDVGRVTSVAPDVDGWVGLAMVSRKLDDDSAIVDGTPCTVEELL
jgi:folate-binding protein YgfZ